eukprot:m.125010 g.125010  ORF g.125010 m.125010 type:complete len:859 (+) comp14484_c0_seq6:31-2607(+)
MAQRQERVAGLQNGYVDLVADITELTSRFKGIAGRLVKLETAHGLPPLTPRAQRSDKRKPAGNTNRNSENATKVAKYPIPDALKQSLDPKVYLNHPPWAQPTGGFDMGLKVNNSLTCPEGRAVKQSELVPFVPAHGKKVLWYTCGPTVYDACHMGHARAYLTFDILRRIMEDYFGYQVLYHVNITDVDDKIILRARRNRLLGDYEKKIATKGAEGLKILSNRASEAVTKRKAKLEKKKAAYLEELPSAVGERKLAVETKLKETDLKLEQNSKSNEKLKAAKNELKSLIEAARDELGESLDDELGATMTDHDIFNAHARRFEKEYMEDMKALGVKDPDVLTRVTEYVPQIVDFVRRIEAKGLAYAVKGSVYLSIEAFKKAGHSYRKLSPGGDTSAEDMAESEGDLGETGEKKHKNDFALWKASKPGEPAWESPWGLGRPGWHIECSCIASDIFGDYIDVHAGGSDLKFPHHDNELAQSEACFGHHQWVSYFFHAGHLHIKGLKMSKSLKNFITIRQCLAEHTTARQLRIMFLLQTWDKPMDYSDQAVNECKTKEKKFRNFFGATKAYLRKDWLNGKVGWSPDDRALQDTLQKTKETVHDSLSNNFNTKGAMIALENLVTDINKKLENEGASPAALLIRKCAVYVTHILRVFGVVEGSEDIGFPVSGGGASSEEVAGPFVDALLDFREKIRSLALANADPKEYLKACDELRDSELVNLGVRLEDTTQENGKSTWKMDDPATLRKEIEDKLKQDAERAKQKIKRKVDAKKKELAKATDSAIPPSEYFRKQTDKYSEFDEKGMPTKDEKGEPLSKKQVKTVAKKFADQEKAYQKIKESSKGDVQGFLDNLSKEIAGMEAELN